MNLKFNVVNSNFSAVKVKVKAAVSSKAMVNFC